MAEILAFLYRQIFLTPTFPTADLTGQTFIVTGSNVGLGLEAARHFARLNADRVILACRSTAKGEAAAKDIETSTARKGVVQVWPLDLESYDSVKAFAARAAQELPRIDGVVENAGIATGEWKTVGGNESTLTVNVVSTFLLALLLIPHLRAVGKKYNITPTLSIVSSEVHAWCKLPSETSIFPTLNKPGSDPKKTMGDRYPISKLLEILALHQLVLNHPASKIGVTINTLNPGFCHSGLMREMEGNVGVKLFKYLLARTTEVGSRNLVWAALQGGETHGKYISDCQVVGVGGVAASKQAAQVQKQVWTELKAQLEEIQPGVTKVLDG